MSEQPITNEEKAAAQAAIDAAKSRADDAGRQLADACTALRQVVDARGLCVLGLRFGDVIEERGKRYSVCGAVYNWTMKPRARLIKKDGTLGADARIIYDGWSKVDA